MNHSLLDDIRHATRTLHRDVEARLGEGHSSWTAAPYVRLLQITHAIVVPLEPVLDARLGDIFSAPPPATRSRRLEADLRAMGAVIRAVPCELTVESNAEAFGVGYVLQGSLLGGAVISRQVRQAMGAGAATGYFGMYGTGLGAAWARYCASLNAFGEAASAADRAAAVSAAVAAFSAFDVAIDRLSC
jgi:heme oxygenase (biliverdin-IX-beta and delta-forming)